MKFKKGDIVISLYDENLGAETNKGDKCKVVTINDDGDFDYLNLTSGYKGLWYGGEEEYFELLEKTPKYYLPEFL